MQRGEAELKRGILVLCLMALLFCGAAAAEGGELKIAVATDMHYLSPSLTDYGQHFMNTVYAADGKTIHYSPQMCKAFVRDMLRLKPDAVILSGDLTLNGARVSLEEFAELLAPLREAGIRVLVIPGNHDIGGWAYSFGEQGIVAFSAVEAPEILRIYGDYGYADALSRDAASLSYTARLDDRVWALMLDVNGVSPQGTVGPETYVWLESQLQAAREAGAAVIGVSHQNLLPHNVYFSQSVMISEAQKLQELYLKYGVALNLSGHSHIQHITAGNITEIVTSSMTLAPGYYGVLTLKNGRPEAYEAIPVDVEGWAAENGETNDDLLHFSGYVEAFYREVVRRKAAAMAVRAGVPEKDRGKMVGFAVELSCRDFSGTRAELGDTEALALWEKYLPDSVYTWYLKSVLADPPWNMDRYDFGGTPEP